MGPSAPYTYQVSHAVPNNSCHVLNVLIFGEDHLSFRGQAYHVIWLKNTEGTRPHKELGPDPIMGLQSPGILPVPRREARARGAQVQSTIASEDLLCSSFPQSSP